MIFALRQLFVQLLFQRGAYMLSSDWIQTKQQQTRDMLPQQQTALDISGPYVIHSKVVSTLYCPANTTSVPLLCHK